MHGMTDSRLPHKRAQAQRGESLAAGAGRYGLLGKGRLCRCRLTAAAASIVSHCCFLCSARLAPRSCREMCQTAGSAHSVQGLLPTA